MNASEARKLFAYDRMTGDLRWRVSFNNRALIGSVASSMTIAGYVRVGVYGKSYLAHRLAWLIVHGRWPIIQIDHINGVRNDNRWMNLREVSHRGNGCNRREHREGKLIGTHRQNSGHYTARIWIRGRRICLGTFPTEHEAHLAYLESKSSVEPSQEKAHA